MGCTETTESCQSQPPADLSGALAYAKDDQLPFRFPLDELGKDVSPFPAIFCTHGCNKSECEYHAAEDYHLPAGTPVYAIADGEISFSGPMGGYGWLIIIDHHQANIYSLYGHLSPSRWRLESGPIGKGDLIAYLGDPDENGSSPEQPLRPHLHFGIRAGQRTDYPGMGEWRWQAGWIKPCPTDLGWIKPSLVITSQNINLGEQYKPTARFLTMWRIDILFSSIYIFCSICMFIFAEKQKRPFVLIATGFVFLVTVWIFVGRAVIMNYVLFAMAILIITIGIYRIIQKMTKKSLIESK